MREVNLGQRYSTVSFSASPELKLELYQTAVNSGVSLSHYVEILIEKGLIFDKKISELQSENEALRKQIAELQNNKPETENKAVSELKPEPINPELENSLLQEISTLKDTLCDHRKAIAELKKYALIKYLNERFAFYVIEELANRLAQNINKNTNPKQFLQVFDEAISEMLTPEKQKVFRQMKANEFLPQFEGEILQIEKQTILKNEHIQTDLQDICPIDTETISETNTETPQNHSCNNCKTEKLLPAPNGNEKNQMEIITDMQQTKAIILDFLSKEGHKYTSKEEAILAKLYDMGIRYISREDLFDLEFYRNRLFGPGLYGKKYGKFALSKKFSDKIYNIQKEN